MSKLAVSKKPKGKPGRKASGLRQVSPGAARLAVTVAALAAVRGDDGKPAVYPRGEADVPFPIAKAVSRLTAERQAIAKATGHVAPELEQMLHGDVRLVQMMAPDGDLGLTLQPVIRAMADPLRNRMEASGFSEALIRVAMQFSADVARCGLGKLTASYGEGHGGSAPDHAIAQAIRMERLIRAQKDLTPKERAAVWAFLVFELPLADIGWMIVGARFGERREPLAHAGSLVVECALERMQRYYEALADGA